MDCATARAILRQPHFGFRVVLATLWKLPEDRHIPKAPARCFAISRTLLPVPLPLPNMHARRPASWAARPGPARAALFSLLAASPFNINVCFYQSRTDSLGH